ncbi:hypothetical protein JB92DRAFT_336154 [Gautieria morchelliformis]|nr:hypothetical protein JB92DRAFT_336154 [Gautieria morchelliformis]
MPNMELLRPSLVHPAHNTYKGLLLVKESLIHDSLAEQHVSGWFCHDCTGALVKNKVPPLALANQM